MTTAIQANNNPLFFAALQNAMGQTQQFTGTNAQQFQNQLQNFSQMGGGINSFSMGNVGPNSFSFAFGNQWGGGLNQGGMLNSPMGAGAGAGAQVGQGLGQMPGMPGAMQGMSNGLQCMHNTMQNPQQMTQQLGEAFGQLQQVLGQAMQAIGNLGQMLQKAMGGQGPAQGFPGAQAPNAQAQQANPCAGKFAGNGPAAGEAAKGGARQVARPGLDNLQKAAAAAPKAQTPAAGGADQKILDHIKNTSGKSWLSGHGEYKKNGDCYEFTKGTMAGFKATPVPGNKGTFNVQNPQGQTVGEWKAPGGADKVASPVAFDLNGDGKLGTTGATTAKDRADGTRLGRTVDFDMNGDGVKEKVEWMDGKGDGLLVDNSDGRAAEDMSGKRLFGDEGGKFNNGYDKLAERDRDGDGKLTGEELRGLEMWVDNGDAQVGRGEMKSLESLGITEIGVRKDDVKNARGETLMQSGAKTADGKQILTEDVWFGKDNGQGR